jgi:1,2-diacylglycerol 3-alpha-glucosyltransferase
MIDRYYAIGDVFASASRSETQGLTYVEAMASGLCVCAVNDACLAGVIDDGISGVLTEDSDEALYIGLLRAFSREGHYIRRTAAQYAAPFSTEAFAGKVEACYEKAIAVVKGVG